MTEQQQSEASQNQQSQVPEWYSKPPDWYEEFKKTVAGAKPAAPPQSTNQGSAGQPGYGEQILTTLAALPEQVAKSIQEMYPNSNQQSGSQNQNDQTQRSESKAEQTSTPTNKESEPGKKTFAERWFGL